MWPVRLSRLRCSGNRPPRKAGTPSLLVAKAGLNAHARAAAARSCTLGVIIVDVVFVVEVKWHMTHPVCRCVMRRSPLPYFGPTRRAFCTGPSIVCLRQETKWTGCSLAVSNFSNFIIHPFTRRKICRRFCGRTYEVSSEFILLLAAAGWQFCLLRLWILACSWSWECWVYSVPSKADTVLAWQVMTKISSGFKFECPFLKSKKKITEWVTGHQGHPHSSLNFCTLASANESSF